MKTAASVVSLVAVFLFARLLSGATENRTPVVSEFVGASPCGAGPRAFLGGIAPTAACHAITWRLTLVTNGSNGPSTWNVAATYGIPARSNPNQMVDGPKVTAQGVLEVGKGTRSNKAAIVYQLKTDRPGRSLDLAHVGDDLLQFLAEDSSLMVGNGGWSYTLNRANRAERTGDDAEAPDMSYTISPRATGPVFGVFEGRTPCRGISRELDLPEIAGCLKVKWRVTLHQNPQTSAPTTYKVESSLHRERPREGTWSIVRGAASHPGAVVYRLSPTGTEKALLLFKGDDNVLFFLDGQQRLLIGNADFSYTLNRITAPGSVTGTDQAPSPKPKPLTDADLQKLRWIEGTWRGTGGGVPPFFERYRFDNPGTLIVETLDGEKVASTRRYVLQNGEFWGGADASRRVATAFDDTSITFEFVARERGSFRWQRVSANAWRAVLMWPAAGSKPAGERVYQLERWPK